MCFLEITFPCNIFSTLDCSPRLFTSDECNTNIIDAFRFTLTDTVLNSCLKCLNTSEYLIEYKQNPKDPLAGLYNKGSLGISCSGYVASHIWSCDISTSGSSFSELCWIAFSGCIPFDGFLSRLALKDLFMLKRLLLITLLSREIIGECESLP